MNAPAATSSAGASPDESTAQSRRSVDVLIAEDSRIQAKMLERSLLTAGHTVRWAINGAEALSMVRERRPAIIVSDIEMPEMTGYELCSAIKKDPALRTIPLILLSTLADPLDIIRGLDAGADNYVTKPYEATYLLARMDALLDTPLDASDDAGGVVLEVGLAGQKFRVKAGRQQVLNLLVSTFENAVTKNKELIVTNQALSVAKDQLQHTNTELTQLNEKIEHSNKRMVRDLKAAAKVQQSLLPALAITIPSATVAWRYVPCQELAGDFLNVFSLDSEHVGLFVVDVSGHGVPSSLLAVTIGAFLSSKVSDSSLLVRPGKEGGPPVVVGPAEVATQLNRLFQADEQAGLYFTFIYGVLHTPTGHLRFVSGGHPPLAHMSREGRIQLIECESFPIGYVPDIEYEEHLLELKPGDRIYLYSDGVPEAMNEALDQMGNERMTATIEAARSQSLETGVVALLDAVQAWCQPKGPLDDVSILGIEWTG
ncbi:MAG: fused response regulator/phosphatase [Planctomycetia bacterium]|nr:fused response regulator/phosphatase [Planctomycetia bacterium]